MPLEKLVSRRDALLRLFKTNYEMIEFIVNSKYLLLDFTSSLYQNLIKNGYSSKQFFSRFFSPFTVLSTEHHSADGFGISTLDGVSAQLRKKNKRASNTASF